MIHPSTPSGQAAEPAADKAALRKRLRACRRNMSPTARRRAALLLVQQALRSGLPLRAQRIGLFVPHGAEINALPLLNRLLEMGKQIYLPVLPKGHGRRRLWFRQLEADSRWVENRFGIPEIHLGRSVRAQALDVLCMPLVAVDPAGFRLGMGGGFYDASLAYLQHRRYWRRPFLLGLAYSCQRLDAYLPHDAWDVPLDAVLTEQGLVRFLRC